MVFKSQKYRMYRINRIQKNEICSITHNQTNVYLKQIRMLLPNPLGRLSAGFLRHGKCPFADIRHRNQIRIIVILVMGGCWIGSHGGGQSVQQVGRLSLDPLGNDDWLLLATTLGSGRGGCGKVVVQRPAFASGVGADDPARLGDGGQVQHFRADKVFGLWSAEYSSCRGL